MFVLHANETLLLDFFTVLVKLLYYYFTYKNSDVVSQRLRDAITAVLAGNKLRCSPPVGRYDVSSDSLRNTKQCSLPPPAV